MPIIVLGIVLIAVSFVLAGLASRTGGSAAGPSRAAWVARSIGAFLVVVGTIVNSAVIVPAGHRGVLLQWGAAVRSLDEGFHLVVPVMNQVVQLEVRTQKEESQATAASRDLQTVTTSLALNFRIDASRVVELYRDVGADYKARVIDPAVQESLKTVTAKFTAEELIKFRPKVKAEVEEEIAKRLANYNLLVEPSGLSITNFAFSEEFNRAIEAKQVAQQQAEQQRYVLQKAELEKQTAIMIAQGKSEAAALNAEALKVQGGSLVISREWIEKWDGKLPSVYGGGQGMIIDLGSLMKDDAAR
jgi:regulator of protease activity HflC (stomatin/prohibitin superfamily)